MLEGVTVCGGVAVGPVVLLGYEFERSMAARLPATEVEAEILRLRTAVDRSMAQVEEIRGSLAGELGDLEHQIVSVHLELLRDPVFLNDIENRIRTEQLRLEDTLYCAVRDFDRIFELAESGRLKGRALDLRDVALRVVRSLDRSDADAPEVDMHEPHIVAARKLSLADLCRLDRDVLLGIVAEEGGFDSHAGILARSMNVPAITGVPSLRDSVRNGDYVVLDAGTGVVHVNPDERLRKEFEVQRRAAASTSAAIEPVGPIEIAGGEPVQIRGACGNLGEVGQAADAGLEGVGVYRTELLFLLEQPGPSEEVLTRHYADVLARAGGAPVRFRLLDAAADQRIIGMRSGGDPNPALGLKGVRLLLAVPSLLRLQIRALLRVAPAGVLEVVVPFVSSVQDVQRIKESIRSERANLLKAGVPCAEQVVIGAAVEVPATAFHVTPVAKEVDFLVVALDDLQQYLLAADRDNLRVEGYYRVFHPALFRLVAQLAAEASAAGREIVLFGESVADPLRLPFWIGVGYRCLTISPVRARDVSDTLALWSVADARELAERVLTAETSLEVQRLLLAAQRQ
ncbi:MAG: phosphoenolpyruvate-utilizing N-terminal domain-containing protein [Planctomycetota bacterium]|nr:phosphoenolpyruvate-utilizing N-terminal domain-containing protein [Planctomycetota bacterium]